MSASNVLHPDQFERVHSTLLEKTLPEIAAHHYSNSPEYMRALTRDIKRNGIQHPVEMHGNDIQEGHHRAAVAYKLGIPMPVSEVDHYSRPEADAYREDTEKWHNKYLAQTFKNAGMEP